MSVYLHRSGLLGGGAVAAAAAWTPAQLFTGAEYGGWWDPGDTSSVYQTGTRASPGTPSGNGDSVGLFLDQAGNEIDFFQTSTDRPSWFTSATDGAGVLSFSNSQFMASGNLSQRISDDAAGFVMAAVFRMDDAENIDGIFFEQDNATAANRAGIYADTRNTLFRLYNFAPDGTNRFVNFGSEQATGWKPIIISSDGTTVTAYEDNVSIGTVSGTANFAGTNVLEIGRQEAGTIQLTGVMGGVVIREGEITASERAQLNTWLKRWIA